MRKHKSIFVFLILVLAGMLLGSFIGELLKDSVDLFAYSKSIGFSPFTVDLSFLKLTLGFFVHMNLASVIGFIVAVIIYKWI